MMPKPTSPQWGWDGTVAVPATKIAYVPENFPGWDGFGVVLETTAFAPAASDVFTPEELTARIEAHSERVATELIRLKAMHRRKGQSSYPTGKGASSGAKADAYARKHNVLLVSCAACRATLLAESEEGRRKSVRTFTLPPPVAMRAGKCAAAPNGRPYCGGCLDRPVRAVVLVDAARVVA